MPGVPTSRACEACRKQKKKCLGSAPACTRCVRLGIPCQGIGEIKFAFRTHKPKPKTPTTTVLLSVPKRPRKQYAGGAAVTTTAPSGAPCNNLTLTMHMFVAALEIPDLRYSLSAIGDFLVHIPRRLGKSEALDAAVGALAAAFPCHYAAQPATTTAAALVPYIAAIRALSRAMDDERTALTPETLCAIYLMMICQGWVGGPDDRPVPHNAMMVHILNSTKARKWDSDFEKGLLQNLRIPMLAESMINPRIDIDWWFLDPDKHTTTPNKTHKPAPPPTLLLDGPNLHFPSWSFTQLGNMTQLLLSPNPTSLDRLFFTYKRMVLDYASLQLYMDNKINSNNSSNRKSSNSVANNAKDQKMKRAQEEDGDQGLAGTLHRMRTCSAIMLSILMYLNYLLRAVAPHDPTLHADALTFPRAVFHLARAVAQYRPLGASYIPVVLACAWGTAVEPSIEVEAEALMDEYQPDFRQRRLVDHARWSRAMLGVLRAQLRPLVPSPHEGDEGPSVAAVAGTVTADDWATFGIVGSCIPAYQMF